MKPKLNEVRERLRLRAHTRIYLCFGDLQNIIHHTDVSWGEKKHILGFQSHIFFAEIRMRLFKVPVSCSISCRRSATVQTGLEQISAPFFFFPKTQIDAFGSVETRWRFKAQLLWFISELHHSTPSVIYSFFPLPFFFSTSSSTMITLAWRGGGVHRLHGTLVSSRLDKEPEGGTVRKSSLEKKRSKIKKKERSSMIYCMCPKPKLWQSTTEHWIPFIHSQHEGTLQDKKWDNDW